MLRDPDRPSCEHVTGLEVFALIATWACQNEDEIAWRCRLAEIGRTKRDGAGAAGTVLRKFGHLAEL